MRRIGYEKLGVQLQPLRFVGIRAADRGTYELVLMDIEANLVEGEPDVYAATTTTTRYVDQKWSNGVEILMPAAARGSLCCAILLEASRVEVPLPEL